MADQPTELMPLETLHADAAYLVGRAANGSMEPDEVVAVIRSRIDAARNALVAQGQDAEPVATLHDDGHWTWKGTPPPESNYAGWRMDVYAHPPRAQAEPESEAVQALGDLVNALRERHYGRMPEEVQRAYDRAWAIVFAGGRKPESAAEPASGAEGLPWSNFPAYLIDHCEGDIISEEGLQRALAAMLKDPKYSGHPSGNAGEPTHAMYAAAQRVELADEDGGTRILNTSEIRRLWLAMAAAQAQPPISQTASAAAAVATSGDNAPAMSPGAWQTSVTGAPERIYLVVGDGVEGEAFGDLHEVTWCADRQGPGDVEYVRAGQAQQDADMYWDADDPESFPATDLHSAVELIVGEYANDEDLSMEFELQCARSMPNVLVRVTAYDNEDGYVYELIDAARQGEGSANG